jgi:hypothetical protein
MFEEVVRRYVYSVDVCKVYSCVRGDLADDGQAMVSLRGPSK